MSLRVALCRGRGCRFHIPRTFRPITAGGQRGGGDIFVFGQQLHWNRIINALQRAALVLSCLYQIGSTIDGCENNLFNEGVLQKTQGRPRWRKMPPPQQQQAADNTTNSNNNNNNRLQQQQQQQQQTSNNNDIWRKWMRSALKFPLSAKASRSLPQKDMTAQPTWQSHWQLQSDSSSGKDNGRDRGRVRDRERECSRVELGVHMPTGRWH